MERKPQYLGPERRQSQTPYKGEERRKPDPRGKPDPSEDETLPPRLVNPSMRDDDTQ